MKLKHLEGEPEKYPLNRARGLVINDENIRINIIDPLGLNTHKPDSNQ
ncbi:MAG: hypothetical protein IJ693_12445 [Bacteroidaceae bacterium]|nr:hypothetical protein [Bacteroidaceae bacterium]MBR1669067.1 hypothetical protein [Bacteroidaceae bacterium]